MRQVEQLELPSYRITSRADRDLQSIRDYLEEAASHLVADRLTEDFYQAFRELARLAPLGHPHDDVRSGGVLVYSVHLYLILFRRTPQVQILRVVHGARDLPHILVDKT